MTGAFISSFLVHKPYYPRDDHNGVPLQCQRPRVTPSWCIMNGSSKQGQEGRGCGAVEILEKLRSTRVVGLGMAGMDLLACVSEFPEPDSKVRTTSLTPMGGGNCANTLTAVRRLGLPTAIISQTGNDVYGTAVRDELNRDGIDTSHVTTREDVSTAFSYVIVDTSAATRTCIATVPAYELDPDRLPLSVLNGASLVTLDGRHTLAAARFAKEANARGVPVLLDVERERPHLREVLPFADYIVTNSSFPRIFSPNAQDDADALRALLHACRARFIIRTEGAKGCTLLRREEPRVIGRNIGVNVQSESYAFYGDNDSYELLKCDAWPVDRIVDTTGAGDAFIGGVAYSLATKLPLEEMLCLASFVASAKLTAPGSRSGLPRREDVPSDLLALQHEPKQTSF